MAESRAELVAYFRSLGFAEERAQEAATVTLRGYGCIVPKGKRSTALSVELGKSAGKDKPISGGKTVQKDGLTYDPASRSFHPTTDAEKGEANAKHPHVPKGSRQGGQFAKKQQADQKKQAAADTKRTKQQAAAQKKAAAATAKQKAAAVHKAAGTKAPAAHAPAKPAGPAKLKALSDAQLSKLAAAAAASKSTDPATVALRKSIASEQKRRAAAAALAATSKAAGLSTEPAAALELSAKTAGYSSTHSPLGKPGGPGLWHHKGWQLPAYIQNIAKGIMESGADRSKAISIAISRVRVWATGGGNVTAEVRAASAKAVAEFEALRGRAHAHTAAEPGPAIELGTVRVSASGDGPRVTENTLARRRLVAKMKRRRARMTRSTDLSWWNPKLHPRVPKGKHGGGEFVQLPGSHEPLSRPGAGPHETAAALRKHLDATSPKKGETVGVSHSKTRGQWAYKAMASAALVATLSGGAHGNKLTEVLDSSPLTHTTHQVERVEPKMSPVEGEHGATHGYLLPPDYAAARGLGRTKHHQPMAEEHDAPKLPSHAASLVVTPPRPTTKAQRKAGVKVA